MIYKFLTLLFALSMTSCAIFHPSLATIINNIDGSTVKLTNVDNTFTCTAFSINEQRGYYMTAAHCLSEGPVTIDGHNAQIIIQDDSLDIAVLRAESFRQALPHRYLSIDLGMPVASYGYGYGLKQPIVKTSRVSQPQLYVEDQLWTVLDSPFVEGMSGGPIVDESGRVMGVVQVSDSVTGGYHAFGLIYIATWRYWER